MRLRGPAEVNLERGVDFDRFDELGTRVHDVPNETYGIRNVGLGEREDAVDRCRVFK